ncbi:hypothetical protein LXA47_10175 [Massilia sp. P8910]|uniref:YtxH domain-containing protein n=1 Tax=Massilia antarctica TaxID=2765360 RepID=A0AA48WF75_9BURK|nr:hypothetical protein [Massilia antarctica]MCE3603968.1 hypothetical protein [Massilia antarctica]QPI50422.1 hypothetical protein IV454_01980 [Massilia antarctica]
MKITSLIGCATLAVALAALAGCHKDEQGMGPAQKAGAKLDKAGDTVGDNLKANVDKAEEAGKKITDAAKATGDKINEATEDASKGLSQATENVGKKVEQAGEKIQEAARK